MSCYVSLLESSSTVTQNTCRTNSTFIQNSSNSIIQYHLIGRCRILLGAVSLLAQAVFHTATLALASLAAFLTVGQFETINNFTYTQLCYAGATALFASTFLAAFLSPQILPYLLPAQTAPTPDNEPVSDNTQAQPADTRAFIIEGQTLRINPAYIQQSAAQEAVIPPAPATANITALRAYFQGINFNNPNGRGYRNPRHINDFNTPLTIEQIGRRIEKIISRVRERTVFTGVPNETPQEKEDYYQKLETLLRHIVHFLRNEPDPDKISSVIVDLAISAEHCGGFYMGETKRLYGLLKNGGSDFQSLTLQGKVMCGQQGLKSRLFLQLMHTESPGAMSGSFNPHAFNYYMGLCGRELGMDGASATFNDPIMLTWSWGQNFIQTGIRRYGSVDGWKRHLLQKFFELYTPRAVIDATKELINGAPGVPPVVDGEVATAWFKENAPASAFSDSILNTIRQEHQASHAARGQERSAIDLEIAALPVADLAIVNQHVQTRLAANPAALRQNDLLLMRMNRPNLRSLILRKCNVEISLQRPAVLTDAEVRREATTKYLGDHVFETVTQGAREVQRVKEGAILHMTQRLGILSH